MRLVGSKGKLILLLLLISLLSPSLFACLPEEEALAMEFIESWARRKGVHPLDKDGNPDPIAIGNIGKNKVGRALGVGGDDPDEDALIDGGEAVMGMVEGDKLMDEAQNSRNAGNLDEAAKKMDEAIAKRPNDYTYGVSRATLALERGNLDNYEDRMRLLRDKVPPPGKPGHQATIDQSIAELEGVRNRLNNRFEDPRQCELLYNGLSSYYQARATENQDNAAGNKAEQFKREAAACKPG